MDAKDVLDNQVSVTNLVDAQEHFDRPLHDLGFARVPNATRDHVPAGRNDDPALWATFASGTSVIAYKYDSRNQLVSYKRLTFTGQSQAPVTKSAIVDGRLAYYLPIGAFAGHWVGATSGLTVR